MISSEIKEETEETDKFHYLDDEEKDSELSSLSKSFSDDIDKQRFQLEGQYTCDECSEIPKIYDTNLSKKTITLKCKNHGQREMNLENYLYNSLTYNLKNVKCFTCENTNFEDNFLFCFDCRQMFCPSCHEIHKKKANHKSLDIKYYYQKCQKNKNHCENSNTGFCSDCGIHFCKDCEKDHILHSSVKLNDIPGNINPIPYLKKLNKEYEEIIRYYEGLIKLNKLLIYSYENYNDNYYNLHNIYTIVQNIKRKQVLKSLGSSENGFFEPGEKSVNYFKYINTLYNLNLKEESKIIETNEKFINNYDLKILISLPITNLQVLDLKNNNITDINCLENANFPELTILNVNNNAIEDISVLEKVNFPNLEAFLARNNNIKNIDVFEKVKMDKIMQIDLRDNAIENIKPFEKHKLQSLQILLLSKNDFNIKKFPEVKKVLDKLMDVEYL